jgi:isopentenyldiphosphate isomerase
MEKVFDVYTKDGEYLGTRPVTMFSEEEPEFYYKTVRVLLLNEDNEILIQKRADTVNYCPSKWEFSASGHVEVGENELDAAIRETKEEIGVSLDKNSIKLINVSTNKNALAHTFIGRIKNSTKFTLQKEEVSEVKYVSLYDFKNLIYTDEFVPKEKSYYESLLDYLVNTLKIDDRNIIKRQINENDLVKSMDSISEDENVKEGMELDSSLKIIDIVIALLLCLLVGIVVYCIIKL